MDSGNFYGKAWPMGFAVSKEMRRSLRPCCRLPAFLQTVFGDDTTVEKKRAIAEANEMIEVLKADIQKSTAKQQQQQQQQRLDSKQTST